MHEFHGCLVLINPGVVTAVVPVWPQNFCKAWLKKKKKGREHIALNITREKRRVMTYLPKEIYQHSS